MKRWIIKNLSGLAAAFGWKLPEWLVRGLPVREREELERQEEALTRALTRGNPRSHEMPPFLEARIERAIAEAGRPRERISWLQALALPATAVAAILLVGVFLSPSIQEPLQFPDGPEDALAITGTPEPASPQLNKVVERLPLIEDGARAENLLLAPLASEPARLALDVTSALRVVAQSVLPESYLGRVNRNLDSIEQEVAKPI